MSTAIPHIDLDSASEPVKQFVRDLQSGSEVVVLELGGRPLLQVRVIRACDQERLRDAILARRDESRVLNEEWEAVDRQSWDAIVDR